MFLLIKPTLNKVYFTYFTTLLLFTNVIVHVGVCDMLPKTLQDRPTPGGGTPGQNQ